MNFKLNLLAAAALMAASVPALAAMDGALSGNGELLLNVRYYNGAANGGADDISGVFDLGVTMNDFLANKNTSGFNMSWNLNAANYGSAFADILAFAGANAANIEFNVIALDSTNPELAGGTRYLTTAAVNAFPALSNSGLNGWSSMDAYVIANNVRGTHATQANGASTAVQADGSAINPVYFGAINGPAGDNWAGKTTADTTAKLGVAQNFYFLTTSSLSNTAASSKSLFGYDLDGNGLLSSTGLLGNEFGKWNVTADGMVSFANPAAAPVPEASTYGMMLAGLGLVGFMARRRKFI